MFINPYRMKTSSMKNSATIAFAGIVISAMGLSSTKAVAVDRFTLLLGTKEYWDSNFARNANVDSEHYTHSVMSLALNERLSKQDFSLGVSGNHYQYAQRDDLDVSFYEGKASWRSDWSPRIKTSIAWTRDAYAVDRLEFTDKDVVARDNFTGQLTLGVGKHFGFTLGARQIAQTHSNELRENLDYDEDELFLAGTYSTASKSSLSLRLREGERVYVHPVPGELQVLDFDCRQLELEGSWALTRKTQVGFTLGRFKREGDINAGTGTQAVIDLGWDMSEKLKLSLSYSQSEPAVGETSDSLADVRTSRVTLAWEPSSKWLFSMAAGYSKQAYLQRALEPARDENIITVSPFALTYRFSEMLRIHLDSQWVDRQSPLAYRDYDYALASFGVALVF
jgi:hypothetical protein